MMDVCKNAKNIRCRCCCCYLSLNRVRSLVIKRPAAEEEKALSDSIDVGGIVFNASSNSNVMFCVVLLSPSVASNMSSSSLEKCCWDRVDFHGMFSTSVDVKDFWSLSDDVNSRADCSSSECSDVLLASWGWSYNLVSIFFPVNTREDFDGSAAKVLCFWYLLSIWRYFSFWLIRRQVGNSTFA